MVPMYKKGGKKSSKNKSSFMEKTKEIIFGDKPKKKGYGGMKYNKGGFPDLNKDGEITKADILMGRDVPGIKRSGGLYSAAEKSENVSRLNKMHGMEGTKKKTGGKSMEPGGGGRFAAMVAGLKKKGKSEGSAKSIAATIGRNKYGKKKFQEMAAKGRKGLGGMSDSTSANEAGMGMMEATETMEIEKRKKKKKKKGKPCTGSNCFKDANKRSGMTWQ